MHVVHVLITHTGRAYVDLATACEHMPGANGISRSSQKSVLKSATGGAAGPTRL